MNFIRKIFLMILAFSVITSLSLTLTSCPSAPSTKSVEVISETTEEELTDKTTEEGVIFIASRGGYYNLPNNYFDKEPPTAFYLKNRRDVSPDEIILGDELSKYINNQLFYCLEEIEITNFEFTFDEPESHIDFERDNILVGLDMHTSIFFEDSSVTIDDYSVTIDNDLLLKSLEAAKLISTDIELKGNLDLTSLFKIADENDFDVFTNTYDTETFIFTLIAREDEQFIYNFVVDL